MPAPNARTECPQHTIQLPNHLASCAEYFMVFYSS
jgi:hypothetical protein